MKIIKTGIIIIFLFLIQSFAYGQANESIKSEIESLHDGILKYYTADFSKITPADLRDIAILESYLNALPLLNDRESNFLFRVLGVMKQYRERKMNTEIQTIGDIDGNGEKDIINSHVFEKHGVIMVESSWKKDHKALWHYTLKNPYSWIGPSQIFQYGRRDIWVIFTIAISDAVPKLIKPFYEIAAQDTQDILISQGIEEIAKIGFKTTAGEYRAYVKSFKGLILEYGDPESRSLDIWYKPAKRFIPYYRP
jgi:hypothetical protein